MRNEPVIRVGIITDGLPEIEITPRGYKIANLLIGDGFHWQKRTSALIKGNLLSLEKPQGNIHIINILPLETYLASVIGSEMNPDAPCEFLKAHAIISRGWALRKITRCNDTEKSAVSFRSAGEIEIREWEESDSHTGFDVCSDDHCQRYQGHPANGHPVIETAIKETRGMVLTDLSGKIADTRFSKCCGGRTEIFSSCWNDLDFEYLISQDDPWCDLSDMDKDRRNSFLSSILKDYDRDTDDFYDWETEIDSSEIKRRLKEKYGCDIGDIVALTPLTYGPSGRIIKLEIEGLSGKINIGKTLAIRRLLAADCLKSSRFEISKTGNKFKLHGHGWGHGAGLCQIGAARMAFEGKSYREILDFYYPTTQLTKLYD